MARVEKAVVPIKDRNGRTWGHITIHLLPDDGTADPAPLLDRSGDPELEPGMASVQLLEGHEYRYAFELDSDAPPGPVSTDRPEIFRPDTSSGQTGRIRPGLYTGTLPVNVCVGGRHLGSFALQVRMSRGGGRRRRHCRAMSASAAAASAHSNLKVEPARR